MQKFEIGDLIEVTEAFFIGSKMRAFDLTSGKVEKGTHGLIVSSTSGLVNILCYYGVVEHVRTDWIKKLEHLR